jgi:hypothetical protein
MSMGIGKCPCLKYRDLHITTGLHDAEETSMKLKNLACCIFNATSHIHNFSSPLYQMLSFLSTPIDSINVTTLYIIIESRNALVMTQLT